MGKQEEGSEDIEKLTMEVTGEAGKVDEGR